MKRFLWFNLEKLKKDPDYFLMTFLFLSVIQMVFYFPTGKSQQVNIVSGIVTSVFFLYTLFCKKEFSYKNVLDCFWKW